MPYEKLKNEQYHNFGGINTKVSPYASGPEEFLNLVNCDFNSPGALQKRQGSTQYLTSGVSGRVVGLYEFETLEGASFVMFGANTHLYYVAAHAPQIVTAGLQDSALLDFTTFVDRLFFANGANFMKWPGVGSTSGSTAALFSLPPGPDISAVVFQGVSSVPQWTNATMRWSVGWINNNGYFGPPGAPVTAGVEGVGANQPDTVYFTYSGSSLAAAGVTNPGGITYSFLNVPASFGIGFGITMPRYTDGSSSNIIGYSYVIACLAVYRDSGPGTQRFRTLLYGYPAFVGGGGTFIQMSGLNSATIAGQARDTMSNFDITTFSEPTSLYFTMAPRYLEIFNNQLMMAGFSLAPSTVWFSDIGDPESVQPDANFEVRTNDGDVVTGLKSYLSQMVIFKQRSFHVLSGDDPTNFAVRQITDQYGCISGRAIAAYENNLVFLDRKGIMLYGGANYEIISNKIEPIFQTMNLAAAKDNAVMIHNKSRNQIWTSIPVNGSTLNNLTIVYDYLLNAWTTFNGFAPSSLANIKAEFDNPTAMYGAYSSGALFYFGTSFLSDNGTGITFLAKTRFFADLGESTQKQFRRFYANVDQTTSASTILNLEFFQDYGASTVLSSSMSLNPFQSRIDFGISGRALAVQITNFSAVDSVRLHGFTIAHRFQRDV